MRIHRIPYQIARWSCRYPKSILSVGAIVTIIATFLALRLELHNDMLEFLPDKMSTVQALRKVLREADGLGYQGVIVKSPDVEKNRAFLTKLRQRVLEMSWKPERSTYRYAQNLYQNYNRFLRDTFLYAKQPNESWRKQLESRVKNFDKEPMVDYALLGYPREFFVKHALLYMNEKDLKTLHKRLKKKIKYEVNRRQPGYVDLLGDGDPGFKVDDIKKKYNKKGFSQKVPKWFETKEKDFVYSAMLVRPLSINTDLIFTRSFMPQLFKLVKDLKPESYHPKMIVAYNGGFSTNLREFAAVERDLQYSIAITIGLLTLLLLVFFRRIRVLILLPVPLTMGTIWAFAFAYLSIGYLTTATSFIGVLILGLGIDYGIYLLDRYLQERREGASIDEALGACFLWTGKAVATAALTTAGAFFALLVCDFTGFSQFGLISGVGIILCLLATHTILPAILILTERWRPMVPPKPLMQVISSSMRRPFPLARSFVVLAIVVIGASSFFVGEIRLESDLKKLGFTTNSDGNSPSSWKRFQKFFAESRMNPIVFSANSEKEIRELSKKINQRVDAYHKKHPKQKRLLSTPLHPFLFVPENQEKKLAWIHKMRDLIKRNDVNNLLDDKKQRKQFNTFKGSLKAGLFGPKDLPRYVQRDLLVPNKDDFSTSKGYLLTLFSDEYMDAAKSEKLAGLLRGIYVDKKRFDPAGEPIMVGELTRVVKMDSFLAMLASLLALSLLVFIDLRSLKLVLMSLWPLATGLLAMAIAQFFLDLHLNMFNLVVLPALLGIGVDGGVHMLHRYRERPDLGTLGVQQELLLPILVASTTTVFSFASLIIAQHAGVRSVGELALVGLLTCLFGSLVLLPALMEVLFRRFPAGLHFSPHTIELQEVGWKQTHKAAALGQAKSNTSEDKSEETVPASRDSKSFVKVNENNVLAGQQPL